MGKNFNYVIHNFDYRGNLLDIMFSIKSFFGEEQTEEFCKSFIQSNNIMRKNDVRNLVQTDPFSVYAFSSNEQVAVLTAYVPIDRNQNLIKNIGLKSTQKFYRNKDLKLAKSIKQMGYSFQVSLCNWKDKTEKDTYQREYVFFIYSEDNSTEQFKDNILNLAKQYNIKSVMIMEKTKSKSPTNVIKSNVYYIKTDNIVEEYTDTTIETIERYLSNFSNTKVLFKIPYEKNKKILYLEEKEIFGYYSKNKQELVRKMKPYSFNSGMIKSALLSNFSRDNYNN